MRILYVEDSAVDIELVQHKLAGAAPETELVAARSVAEARQAWSGDGRYDVLLLDLNLPDGSGLELLAELRAQADPVAAVVLTGADDMVAVKRALQAGADEFLVKDSGYLSELANVVDSARRKASARVLENERRFRRLFESMSAIAVQAYDRDRRVLFWNKASESLYGYAAEEALGRRLEELIVPEPMRPTVVEAVQSWVDGVAVPAAAELTLMRKDGSPTHVYSSHVMLDGPDGQPEMVCIDVDLNQQCAALRELARSEARYRRVVDNVSEVIFQLDTSMRLTFLNPAWESLTGVPVSEALGRPLADFVFETDLSVCAALLGSLFSGERDHCRHEVRFVHSRDGFRWVEGFSRLALDDDGLASGAYGTLVDVTERVRLRELQQARNDVLNLLVADAPLDIVLRTIIECLEEMLPGLSVAIMLLDPETGRLESNVSVSLPAFYVAATRGLEAREGVGACGTAVARGEPVIVEDVLSHPHWADYRAIVSRAGLRSCWSMPFMDENGEVLGTTAVYGREPRKPLMHEIDLIREFASLVSVAMQKRRSADMLRQRELALNLSASAALELLREQDLQVAILRVLETAGLSTDVDRAYVFENASAPDSGELLSSLRHEWVREGVSSQVGNPALINAPIARVMPRWYAALRAGEIVQGDVDRFPDNERAVLEPQGVRSILIVPVIRDGNFWGFIGFDAVRVRKTWTRVEENVLRIIATSLCTAFERKQSMEKLRRSAAAFESTRDGVIMTDLTPRIVMVNRAFTEITGYAEAEALGRNPNMIRSGRQDADFFRAMWRSVLETGHWQGEIWNRRKGGEVYPQWLTISTVRDEQGKPTHYVGVMTDISQLKRSEAELERLAHYDPLTGLPNRVLARLRLEHAIDQAQRYEYRIGVLFIDLDRFKNINDSFGHPVGDQLLSRIALRLKSRVRAEDTLARLGGDEFLLILEHLSDPAEAAQVAQALIRVFDQPFELDGGREVYVGCSVGISLYPDDGKTTTELIQHADTALYQAKSQGRGTYRYFTLELSEFAHRRIELETRLRRAIDRGQLVLHYQPQVETATGRIVGCEALLRWNDPESGLVPPDRFIPIAEESGLIVALGEWALRTACEQGSAWLARGLQPMKMAVNLSARQLGQSDLPERVEAILRETAFPARHLELELTESMIMGQETLADQRFGALKALGILLAIDDFGTGYSSLAYLKRFPIDVLKIDRSFVRDIPRNASDMEIAAAIIAMARSLRLSVVAEGVETQAQTDFLRALSCDVCQGYYFSRPVPAEHFERLLRDGIGSGPKAMPEQCNDRDR